MLLIQWFYTFQFEDDDIEEDTPLEKRKKTFSKECKYCFTQGITIGIWAISSLAVLEASSQ